MYERNLSTNWEEIANLKFYRKDIRQFQSQKFYDDVKISYKNELKTGEHEDGK